MFDGLLTAEEAAKLTGYNEEYIRELCRQDKLQAQRIGRTWVIDRGVMLAYKAQHEEFLERVRPIVKKSMRGYRRDCNED